MSLVSLQLVALLVTKSYPIPLFLVGIGLGPELLDAQKQPHPIANLVDSHFFEHFLVHFKQILSVDVILPKQLLVLAALDAAQVFAHPLLIPVLDRIRAFSVREL